MVSFQLWVKWVIEDLVYSRYSATQSLAVEVQYPGMQTSCDVFSELPNALRDP